MSIYNLKSILAEASDNLNRIFIILNEYEKTKDFIETEFLLQNLIFELDRYLDSDFLSIRILEKCKGIIEKKYGSETDFSRKVNKAFAYAKIRSNNLEEARELLYNGIMTEKSSLTNNSTLLKDGYEDWIRNKEDEWQNMLSTGSYLRCFALQYNTLFEKGFAFMLCAKSSLEDRNQEAWRSRLNDIKRIAKNILKEKLIEINEDEYLVFENLPLSLQNQLDLPILFLYVCHFANKSQNMFRLEISQDTLVYGEINEKDEIENVPVEELAELVNDEGLRFYTIPSLQKTNIKNLKRSNILLLKNLNEEILSSKPLNMIITRERKDYSFIKKLIISMIVVLFSSISVMLYKSIDFLNGGYILNGKMLEVLNDRGRVIKKIKLNRFFTEKEIIPLGEGNYIFIHFEENRLFLSKNVNDKIFEFNEYDIPVNSYYAGGGKLRDSDLIYLKFFEISTDGSKSETVFYIFPSGKISIMKPVRIRKDGYNKTSSPYSLKNYRLDLIELY